jgi:hypothetical protein
VNLEHRLKNYANWLKLNAKFCLMDDFFYWPDFYEYKILRARADYLRSGKDEMVLTPIKGENGKLKLEKQPHFKEKLDYAKKLREEIAGTS